MARVMKDSGVAWIGEIPEGWFVQQLKRFVTVNNGKDVVEETDQVEDAVPVYGSGGVFKYTMTPMYKGEAVMFGRKGTLGKPMHVNGAFWTVDTMYYLTFMPELYPRFCYYQLQVFDWQPYITQTALPSIVASDIVACSFAFPIVSEQSRIAAFLDHRCAEIDCVIAATQRTIEEYKKLKQSIITEAVTHGVRGPRKMKDSGVEWLGMIPENWSVYRIANVYDERNESGSDDLPILLVSINTGISDHEVSDDEQTRSFVRIEDRTKYKRVYPGDLAYNMMRAWQGAFGAARVDGMVSPAYVVAKPKGNASIDSRYMEALLRSPSAIDEMHRFSHGITDFRLRLYWPEFKSIRICIPPHDEQIEIADYIDQKSSEIDRLIEAKQCLLAELEAYKKSVIYEYVTGKREVVE